MRRLITIIILAICIGPGLGQTVPPMINYQGQLLNSDGTPLTTADYALTFKIYDAAQGGTLVWGPQIFDGRSGAGLGPKIPVVQGYFNVILGPSDTNGVQLSDAFSVATRYLEVAISNQPPIAPRQQILSAPYALSSKYAQFATMATNANSANFATSAGSASYALTAGLATNAVYATNAQNLGGIVASNYFLGLVPVGSVIAYYGSLLSLPGNWKYCDGSQITNSASPLFGTYVPDLRSAFIMGTGPSFDASLGWYGGMNYISDHSHPMYHTHHMDFYTLKDYYGSYWGPGANPNAGGNAYMLGGTGVDSIKHQHEVQGDSQGPSSNYTSSAGGHDNRPAYVALNYIMRIW